MATVFEMYRDEFFNNPYQNPLTNKPLGDVMYQDYLNLFTNEEVFYYYQDRFLTYPSCNPITNFPIKIGGETYNKLTSLFKNY